MLEKQPCVWHACWRRRKKNMWALQVNEAVTLKTSNKALEYEPILTLQ